MSRLVSHPLCYYFFLSSHCCCPADIGSFISQSVGWNSQSVCFIETDLKGMRWLKSIYDRFECCWSRSRARDCSRLWCDLRKIFFSIIKNLLKQLHWSINAIELIKILFWFALLSLAVRINVRTVTWEWLMSVLFDKYHKDAQWKQSINGFVSPKNLNTDSCNFCVTFEAIAFPVSKAISI